MFRLPTSALVLFFKAEQFGLFGATSTVSGYVNPKGTFVAPYQGTRHHAVKKPKHPLSGHLFAQAPHEVAGSHVQPEAAKPQTPKATQDANKIALPERVLAGVKRLLNPVHNALAALENARATYASEPGRSADTWSDHRDRVIAAYQKMSDAIQSIPNPTNREILRRYLSSQLPDHFLNAHEVTFRANGPADIVKPDWAKETTPTQSAGGSGGNSSNGGNGGNGGGNDESDGNENPPDRISEEELTQRGQRVRQYVDQVNAGTAKHSGLRVGIIGNDAAKRIVDGTKLPADGALEVVVANAAIHATREHPDLTDSDWERLPRLTNQFDDVARGRPGIDKETTRIIIKKVFPDGTGYGAVLEFAAGRRGKRLNLVTYFKGRGKSLEALWNQNKLGLDSTAIPNLTESSSKEHSFISKPDSILPPPAPEGKPEVEKKPEPESDVVDIGAKADARKKAILDHLADLGWSKEQGILGFNIGGNPKGGELNPKGHRWAFVEFRGGTIAAFQNKGFESDYLVRQHIFEGVDPTTIARQFHDKVMAIAVPENRTTHKSFPRHARMLFLKAA